MRDRKARLQRLLVDPRRLAAREGKQCRHAAQIRQKVDLVFGILQRKIRRDQPLDHAPRPHEARLVRARQEQQEIDHVPAVVDVERILEARHHAALAAEGEPMENIADRVRADMRRGQIGRLDGKALGHLAIALAADAVTGDAVLGEILLRARDRLGGVVDGRIVIGVGIGLGSERSRRAQHARRHRDGRRHPAPGRAPSATTTTPRRARATRRRQRQATRARSTSAP